MLEGWIKLHRQLLQKPIWQESTPEQKVILITLLMMANHKGKEWEWKGKSYKAKPGQFVTSLPSIVKRAGKGISVQNVRTALKRFKKYEFLTGESTNQNRLITIVNWESYQSEQNEANNQPNSQLTGTQQTPNRPLTPNKNDKNNNIYIMSSYEGKFIDILKAIKGWPLDLEKDVSYLHTLEERYPDLDILAAAKKFSDYILDNPFKKNSNHRSQLNTSCNKYVEWKTCLKSHRQDAGKKPRGHGIYEIIDIDELRGVK